MRRRKQKSAATATFIGLAAWTLLAAGCGRESADGASPSVLRLGYQKWSTFNLLKSRQTLERRLAGRGIAVQWVAFPAGPPLLEALNAGSIDLGHSGDSPPVFAQAAGVPFVYVAASDESPAGSAIVTRMDSSAKVVADLKGKRLGFTKGSSAHTLVLRALAHAGLTIGDVECVFLSPADARAALAGGSIDAWSIWDPYLAAAEQAGEVRVLTDGRGLVAHREFYLAAATVTRDHPELIEAVLDELREQKTWAAGRAAEIAERLAPEIGLDAAVIELAERRRQRYGVFPVDGAVLADQQATADAFYECGLIPRRIAIRDAVRDSSPTRN